MANHRVVIDTDVFVEYLRLRSPKRKLKTALFRVNKFFDCYTTSINKFELFAGCNHPEQVKRIKDVLWTVKSMSLEDAQMERIGWLASLLRRRGQIIGEMDTIIAGICLENQMPIVTRNTEHFDRVPDLWVIPAGVIEAYEEAGEIIKVSKERSKSLANQRA